MASAAIAAHFKTVLTSLINEDQTGFLPGRFIGDNIRLVYDILFYTEKHNLPGIILWLDFATAFDSISWDFVFIALRYFNFGEDLIKWVILQKY